MLNWEGFLFRQSNKNILIVAISFSDHYYSTKYLLG